MSTSADSDDATKSAASLAERLGETAPAAILHIKQIVDSFGVGFAEMVLAEALKKEAEGGLLFEGRRRTPGGVFFYLARSRVSRWRAAAAATRREGAPAERPKPPLRWNERIQAINEAKQDRGEATNVKITVIGKPRNVAKRGACVVAILESRKAPSLPRGLPAPPAAPTTFAVFVAEKQWKKVEQRLQQAADDVLIVEGFPMLDGDVKAILVFATSVTTKTLQNEQRAQRDAHGPKTIDPEPKATCEA